MENSIRLAIITIPKSVFFVILQLHSFISSPFQYLNLGNIIALLISSPTWPKLTCYNYFS